MSHLFQLQHKKSLVIYCYRSVNVITFVLSQNVLLFFEYNSGMKKIAKL